MITIKNRFLIFSHRMLIYSKSMKLYDIKPIYVIIIATIILLVATFFNTITYPEQVTEEFYYRRRSKIGGFFKKVGSGIKKGATKTVGGIKKGAVVVGGGIKKGAAVVGGGIKKGAIKVGGGIKKVTSKIASKITKRKEIDTNFGDTNAPAIEKKTYSGPEGSLMDDESELYKSPVALKSTGKASSPEFNFDSLKSHNTSCSAAMSRCNSPFCLADGTLMTCANEYLTYMTKTDGLIPTYQEGDWDGFKF